MNNRLHKGVIMISKNEIDNLNFYELTLLSCIKYIIIPKYNSSEVHEIKLNDVINILNNNSDLKSDKLKRLLSKSFKSLLDKKMFEVTNKIGKRYYIKRESLLIKPNSLYVSITHKEFKNIFSTNLTTNLIKLYGYYIKLLSTININTKIGYNPIIKLSEKFNISERTVINYNSQLEKLKLISIYRHKTYNEETGKFRSYNNIYYKPCDREFICKRFKVNL